MARLARLNMKDVPQHIIQRGNNRQATFFADEDYQVYLDKLKEYAEKYKEKQTSIRQQYTIIRKSGDREICDPE